MEKNIKDYLHLYLGSADYSVRYVDYDPGVWTLFSKLTPDRYLRIINDAAVENIQLRLRKLESMTEEEATDVYTIERDRVLHFPTNDFDVRRVNNAWQVTRLDILDTKLFIVDDGVVFKVTEDNGKPMIEYTRNMPLIFHYLLSKGFDLFGLLDSGLAIEKQPTTQNQGV